MNTVSGTTRFKQNWKLQLQPKRHLALPFKREKGTKGFCFAERDRERQIGIFNLNIDFSSDIFFGSLSRIGRQSATTRGQRSAVDGGSWGPTRPILDSIRTGYGVQWTGEEVEEEMGPRFAF